MSLIKFLVKYYKTDFLKWPQYIFEDFYGKILMLCFPYLQFLFLELNEKNR